MSTAPFASSTSPSIGYSVSVLQNEHRVGPLHRRERHAAGSPPTVAGVSTVIPGDVGVPPFEAVRVLRPHLAPAATRQYGQQAVTLMLPAGHVAQRRGVVEHLPDRASTLSLSSLSRLSAASRWIAAPIPAPTNVDSMRACRGCAPARTAPAARGSPRTRRRNVPRPRP